MRLPVDAFGKVEIIPYSVAVRSKRGRGRIGRWDSGAFSALQSGQPRSFRRVHPVSAVKTMLRFNVAGSQRD